MTSRAPGIHTTLIESIQGWEPLKLKDIWEYRELLFFLVWRDIKVSYARTALGVAWAVLKPVATMVMFSIVFGWLVKVPSDGVPYPIFVLTALLPWQLFARSMAGSSTALVANENLITKVYFPRLVMPFSAAVAGILDIAIASVVLLGMMWFYHIVPTTAVWTLPFFMMLAMMTALGVGLWLSALNLLYRDVGHASPFLTQLWMFATPIIYPSSLVSESLRVVYWLNPMVGVVEGFRWALLGTGGNPGLMLALPVFVALALLLSGLYFFRRLERTFADMV